MYKPTLETIILARKTASEFCFDLAGMSIPLGYPRELKDELGRVADHWYRFLKAKEDEANGEEQHGDSSTIRK